MSMQLLLFLNVITRMLFEDDMFHLNMILCLIYVLFMLFIFYMSCCFVVSVLFPRQ